MEKPGPAIKLAWWRTFRIFIFVSSCVVFMVLNNDSRAFQDATFTGFKNESVLSRAEKLDAMRFLQARISQDEDSGTYLVRDVSVLIPEDSTKAVFGYLVTYQDSESDDGTWDLGDFYSVSGYYVLFLTRTGDDFIIRESLSLMPDELAERLGIKNVPPPPVLVSNKSDIDYTAAIFNAMDPGVIEWRDKMVATTVPRLDWVDITGDGLFDFVLDIEGFMFEPTSYYTVMVSTDSGFEEGYHSWGYDTDFSEVMHDDKIVIRSDIHTSSANGHWLPVWVNFYVWNGERFVMCNSEFPDEYEKLVPSLIQLADESLSQESDPDRGWAGIERYAINATRYSRGEGIPSEYYFNLARACEYQQKNLRAKHWWETLRDYIDEEYTSQQQLEPGEIDPAIRDIVLEYEEWRDEIYAAAENALSDELPF